MRRKDASAERHARAVSKAREHLGAREPVLAERAFREALRHRPGDAIALSGIGHCLRLQQREPEAVRALLAAADVLRTTVGPGGGDALLDIAFELQEALAPEPSLTLLDVVLTHNPSHARAWHLRARACQRMSRIEDGLAAAMRATELAPAAGNAQLLRAELEQAAGHLEAAHARLSPIAATPSHPQRVRALRLLGSLHDAAGRYPEAFACMRDAGALLRASAEARALNGQRVMQELARVRTLCDAAFFDAHRDDGAPTTAESPVFLLGYLRSGTTLLEQVFSAHPAVTVTNETSLMPSVLHELRRLGGGAGDWSTQLERIGPGGLARLRAHYFAEAAARFKVPPGDMLLDKTAMNTLNIALINLLFPNARAIFALRDPRDVAISCFMQPFELSPITVHWLDWEDGARMYAETMSFWRVMRERLSLGVVVCRYEHLVEDLRGAVEPVLAHCGLEWHDACEAFHIHERGEAIRTPSYAQATRPIYKRAVGRWRGYAEPIAAIRPVLAPALVDFGYA